MVRITSRRINPVKAARTATGLTLAQASEEAGVHLQAFFLQEQGVYPEILPAVQSWLVLHEVSIAEATKEYHDYQTRKRSDNGELHGVSLVELGPPEGNPVVGLRSQLGLSRMGFAKQFCVHPGLLYRVERSISKSLPDQLRCALVEAGFSDSVIAELAYRMEEL